MYIQGKMIVLDLYSEVEPQYLRLKSYFGQPFVWCMLHNFGGTLSMYGAIQPVNEVMNYLRWSRLTESENEIGKNQLQHIVGKCRQ